MTDNPNTNEARPVMRRRPGEARTGVVTHPFLTPADWERSTESLADDVVDPQTAKPADLCPRCPFAAELQATDQLEEHNGKTVPGPPLAAHRPKRTNRPPTVDR